MKVLLFPGQGSQFLEMKQFISKEKFLLGEKILNLSLEDFFQSEEDLKQTHKAQIAIFLHSISVFEDLKIDFDLALGHSLGEYSALYACGLWSFETALKIVNERGRLMSQCEEGSMWVILSDENLSSYSAELKNNNSLDQWIFSGLEKDFLEVEKKIRLDHEKIKIISLKVSGAFHSSLMKKIVPSFKNFLQEQEFFLLKKPYISNVTGQIHSSLTKEEIIELLTRQLVESVLWRQSLEKLQTHDECYELGPGKVLKSLMKKNRPEIIVSSFQSKEDFLSLGQK